MKNETQIKFIRVKSDINGNPRYVFHFMHLSNNYDRAIKLAREIGGKRYRGKDYGELVVIQSYNLNETAKHIREIRETV